MENVNNENKGNEGQKLNQQSPFNQAQQAQKEDDNTSLAMDGPISQNEGDGGADLNDTDVEPGSEEAIDDLDLQPNDDLNTDVEPEDLQALEGLDKDENNRL